MPDLTDLFKKWWKQILFTVVLAATATGAIVFLSERQYLSVATAVPASTYLSDKSKVFNENIEALYSSLGTADDLDLVTGTAKLDTVYLAVTDLFNLADHYKTKEKGDAGRTRSAALLKKNTRVMKSEYGELKVKVWDTDRNLAPQLANAVLDQLQAIHTRLQNNGNEVTLQGLLKRKEQILLQIDSAGGSPEKLVNIKEQLAQYEKYISEYRLMIDTKPPALIVVEKAKAAERPDRPRRMQFIIAAAFLGFLFSLLVAVVLDRKKQTGSDR